MLRVVCGAGLLLALAACQHSTATRPAKAKAKAKPAAEATPAPPKVKYSDKYEKEIEEVFALARNEQWEDAEKKASALYEKDPQDRAVQRLRSWVQKEGQARREKALEDKIRDLDYKDSQFNTSPTSVLKDKKYRGLAPRKDVRDAIEQIEATPYVPPSYGKTIEEKGPLFTLEETQGRMAEILEKEVSVHLDNVTLADIIFNVGQAQGINFVADKTLPAFQQKLSVNMDKVKLSEFLRYVSRNLEVQFQVGKDLIWIVDGKDPKKVLEETRFYRLRRGFILPAQYGASETTRQAVTANNITTVTETTKIEKFVRDGAPDKPSIEGAIRQFFDGSKFIIDYERNLIVARGTHEQLRVMEKIIEEYDRPLRQVFVEARFITVSQAAFLQLGASWETGRSPFGARTPADFSGLGENIGTLGLGLQETFTNVLSRRNLSVTLAALEQSGESQTLSAPRIALVNNLPAKISDGKIQYYYEEFQVRQTILERRSTSSFVPSGKPTKLSGGVSLDLLASIGGDGKSILLALHPEVNQDVKLVTYATLTDVDENGKVVSTFDIKLPETRTQSLSTRAVIKSGQTIVMGGVLEREQRTFVESVPILGNIPLIGAAFRKRTEIDKPRYLLIFVTATLLSDSGEYLIYDDEDEAK
ncbi:MAG: type II secretion system protein GspD [Verrucomicrobia bacterium]|nr:type II secretion system protein GspD [Verrucomicrobiota bacterium]